MAFRFAGEPEREATRIPLQEIETRFESGMLRLRGRLVLPEAAPPEGPVLAVLVHGSEDYSAVERYALQYMLPALGVAAFVYDKRGTGESEGEYTQEFDALAADTVAALAEARRLHPPGFSRVGFVRGSQGGWIGPLAASRSRADFVAALYGLAEGPLAEDREEVLASLRRKGHGEDVLRKAREITAATGRVIASDFREGFDELARVRRAYGSESWIGDIDGEFTQDFLRWPGWMLRLIGPFFDRGTSWEYESMKVLEALEVPQLRVLAEQDREAPHENTLALLCDLQRRGRPVDIAVFPDTDHGIYEFVEEDGERIETRHADGYHRLLADWLLGAPLTGPYGRARIEIAASRAVAPPVIESPITD